MDNATITYRLESSNPVLGLDEAQRALMEKLSTNENETQYEWKIASIVADVVSKGSKEKAMVRAKELRNLWVRYAYLGIIKPSVIGYDGEVAWTISDCNGSKDKMLTCLYDAIDGYFQTFRDKDDERDDDPAYRRLERFRTAVIGSCKDEFAKYDLRNKIPMLKQLSDESYDLFCLEFMQAKIGYAVALLHTVKIDEYTGGFISKNQDCTHEPIFESYNEMYGMVERIKDENAERVIKGQFEVLRNPNNTNKAIRNNSPKYLERARNFYQSLKDN